MNDEVFQSGWWKQALFPALYWCEAPLPLIFSSGSSLSLRQFPQMCVLISTLLNNESGGGVEERDCLQTSRVQSLCKLLLCLIVLWTLATWSLSNPHLCLSSIWTWLWFLILELKPGETLKAAIWNNRRACLLFYSSFTVFSCLMSNFLKPES